jgi:hypothetical protein
MKKKFKLLIFYIFIAQNCIAAQKRIIDLVTQKLENKDILSYCQGKQEKDNTKQNFEYQLIQIQEFGEIFSGCVLINELNLEKVSWYTKNQKLPPEKVGEIFIGLQNLLKNSLGKEYFVENIPNFQDATTYENDAYVWLVGEDIIILSSILYSQSGYVSLTRESQKNIILSGADYGKYWDKIISECKLAIPTSLNEKNASNIRVAPEINTENSADTKKQPRSGYEKSNGRQYLISTFIVVLIFFIMILLMKSSSSEKIK